MFFEKLLHEKIPKVQNDKYDMPVFLHFWDLFAGKLKVA